MFDTTAHKTSLTKADIENIMENPYTAPAAAKTHKEYENGEINRPELIQEMERFKDLLQTGDF